MKVDSKLVNAAIDFVKQRFSSGTEGAAAVYTPCGVCQERYWVYGGDVDCAVPKTQDSTEWSSVKLSVLSPSYWRKPFMD